MHQNATPETMWIDLSEHFHLMVPETGYLHPKLHHLVNRIQLKATTKRCLLFAERRSESTANKQNKRIVTSVKAVLLECSAVTPSQARHEKV